MFWRGGHARQQLTRSMTTHLVRRRLGPAAAATTSLLLTTTARQAEGWTRAAPLGRVCRREPDPTTSTPSPYMADSDMLALTPTPTLPPADGAEGLPADYAVGAADYADGAADGLASGHAQEYAQGVWPEYAAQNGDSAHISGVHAQVKSMRRRVT
jgi:hypothetical protein